MRSLTAGPDGYLADEKGKVLHELSAGIYYLCRTSDLTEEGYAPLAPIKFTITRGGALKVAQEDQEISGFAYSTMTATTYASLDDQYNCVVGHGANDSKTFAVVYYNSYAKILPTVGRKDRASFEPQACFVTNSAYAYTSMKEGDAYAKKFDENDWFLITATGYLDDVRVGTAEYYLAQNGQIADDWGIFDLSGIGTVDRVLFSLSSSDNGEWGMNTPAYFCLDNFNEPLTIDNVNLVNNKEVSAATYNLQGQRVTEGQGFMIRNGKVIMVRNR
jgi:hypothetical protein